MRQDRTRLYAGVGAAVLLAAAGGFGLAKLTSGPAAPAAAAEEEGHADGPEGAVAMPAEVLKTSGIVVQPVQAGGFAAEILAQATVSAAPGGQALVTARAAGAVTRINVRLGDPVRAGQALAVVESREAGQIAAERAAAQAKATLAQRNLAREKSLFEQRVSPRMDYEAAQAEAAAANAEARRAQAAAGAANVTSDGRGVVVTSPISGRVTAAAASLGSYVSAETELFRVANTSQVQIEAALPGADAARVRPGDRASVTLSDGRVLDARVRSVTPGLDPESRTATAVLDVAGVELQPGQSGQARIFPRNATASRAIVVPEEAVQSVEGRDVVFVRTAAGFQAVPVVKGQTSAGRTEILSGLKPGQPIAARGAFLLKAELGKGEGDEH